MDGTVLVADDDRTIRTVLTQALTLALISSAISAALLLRYQWHEGALATRIEDAVQAFLAHEGHCDFGTETTRVVAQGVLALL